MNGSIHQIEDKKGIGNYKSNPVSFNNISESHHQYNANSGMFETASFRDRQHFLENYEQ
jgi:hypothetical protein